ncbi:hypothetical protein [Mesorhizobium sp. M1273]|uniref:hypothetical protein n=1 Tax=Mesorhizobium sp. M1273 TaxID=2957075 RepID=UPI00333C01A9
MVSSARSLSELLPGANRFSPFVGVAGAPLLLASLVVTYAVWLSTVAIPTNVDVSWLLVVCDRLLGGERLNTDIVETNPPFSIWLYMPFMLLEKLTGMRAEFWLTLGVVCLSLASLFVSVRILARDEPVYRQPHALWAAAAALFLILCFMPDQFGQREHFALIAILPWVALQCTRQRNLDFSAGSRLEHMVAGFGAAVVVMVKPPYFVLAFMLPSLCLALERRSLRPLFVAENLVGAAIVAAYIASIALFDRAYVSDVLPLVREVYLPLRASAADMLANWPKVVLLLAAATVLAAGGLRKTNWDVRIPLLTALGFIPAFIVMGKGWPNHALPMVVVATLAFGIQLVRFGTFGSAGFVRKAALIFGCVLVLQIAVRAQYAALTTDNGPIARSVAAIRATVETPTVMSIADQMQVAHPLARLVGGRFISRHPSAWAVSNADTLARVTGDLERRPELESIRDRVIGENAAEISAKKPDIVLSGSPAWTALMLQDKRIQVALADYRLLHAEPEITVYLRYTAPAPLQTDRAGAPGNP